MKNEELALRVSRQVPLSTAQVERVLNKAVSIIATAKSAGEPIELFGFGDFGGEETTEPKPPTPEPTEEPGAGEADPPVDDWKLAAVDYLAASSAETIAADVKGIGQSTADRIKSAEQLTWETVESVLNAGQIEALKAVVEAQKADA